MANLGDSPMYLFNGIAESFQSGLGAGAEEVWLIAMFGIVAFLALYLKLDRGAIALLSVIMVGISLQLGIISDTIFYLMLLILAAVAAYGFLQTTRQGEG